VAVFLFLLQDEQDDSDGSHEIPIVSPFLGLVYSFFPTLKERQFPS
jgi:hypothetical protein